MSYISSRIPVLPEKLVPQAFELLGALGERLRAMGHETGLGLLVDGQSPIKLDYGCLPRDFNRRDPKLMVHVDNRRFRVRTNGTFNVAGIAKAVSEWVAASLRAKEHEQGRRSKERANHEMLLRVMRSLGLVSEDTTHVPTILRNMKVSVSPEGVQLRIEVKRTDDEGDLRCMLNELETIGAIWRHDEKGESIWR
jgi:hypothetical protein